MEIVDLSLLVLIPLSIRNFFHRSSGSEIKEVVIYLSSKTLS